MLLARSRGARFHQGPDGRTWTPETYGEKVSRHSDIADQALKDVADALAYTTTEHYNRASRKHADKVRRELAALPEEGVP